MWMETSYQTDLNWGHRSAFVSASQEQTHFDATVQVWAGRGNIVLFGQHQRTFYTHFTPSLEE
jgi:hypothetical protein